MKPRFLKCVILLSNLCSLSGNAQDKMEGSRVKYDGVMSLPVHWVQTVADQGKRVVLEDSSVWQICPHCAPTVSRWSLNYHVVIVDRGTTYKYSYSLVASFDGDVGAPVHAICVKAAKVRQQSTATYD